MAARVWRATFKIAKQVRSRVYSAQGKALGKQHGEPMVKRNIEVRAFKIRPETEKEQIALDIFYGIREGADLSKAYMRGADGSSNFINEYLNFCQRRGFIKPLEHGQTGRIEFNEDHQKFLGIGFSGEECFLTVMDLKGNIAGEESIKTELLLKSKEKKKDIMGIVREIASQTSFKGREFYCCGIAIPEEITEFSPQNAEIFAKGIGDIFKCSVLTAASATAAGYADRDSTAESRGKEILYMYSDVGIGVVMKKELIFEADEYTSEKHNAYLRPWNHFSVVNTTKNLVEKGVGTDIVEMVRGDINRITLDIVFEAAKRNDELAEDLVKRSGLALGVRVAYLVSMFNVDFVLLGGGIESDEAFFIRYVKESMGKFISEDVLEKITIIPGVLGKKSSSIGAGLLCRREIFMEV